MAKEKRIISKLNYGEVHLYYPLKFDTKLFFEDLCEKLVQSNIGFNEQYMQRIMDSIGQSLANDNIEPMYDIDGDNIRIEIIPSANSIDFNFVSTEIEALKQRVNRLDNEFILSDRIYGPIFTSNQRRIILVPFKATLYNDKVVWIYAILIVFRNNMGVLKLELPLIDTDIEPLKKYDIDSLVKSINNYWKKDKEESDITLSELSNHYLKLIVEDTGVEIKKFSHDIRNIIFIDFDEMPNQIDTIPVDIQEELYKIIAAPVPCYSFSKYEKEAKEHIQNYSWGKNGIKYIIKTNGGILSVVDKRLLNYKFDIYKENKHITVIDDKDYIYTCSDLAYDLNSNVEFAILIIMLKKTNECINLYQKLQKKHELYKIQNEYYENVLFINGIQAGCYGSVIDQTDIIEKMMYQYLRSDLNQSNQNALDSILREEEQRNKEQFYNFVSIGTLFLSIIFGLPSIFEALCILRKATWGMLVDNIPILTLENVSITLWILINVIIILRLKKNSVHVGTVPTCTKLD